MLNKFHCIITCIVSDAPRFLQHCNILLDLILNLIFSQNYQTVSEGHLCICNKVICLKFKRSKQIVDLLKANADHAILVTVM